jgi:aspartate/methionine/tyrosine aminotransferase
MSNPEVSSNTGAVLCKENTVDGSKTDGFFKQVAPMGIYETIYSFEKNFGRPLGSEGTLPWTHGVPSHLPIPGGPDLPSSVDLQPSDLKYGKISGMDLLREKICNYYRENYNAEITADNVMVFSGVRPALFAVLLHIRKGVHVRVASTEYPPYWNMLEQLEIPYSLVHSGEDNMFHPRNEDYFNSESKKIMAVVSNPTNPTGVTKTGSELHDLVRRASQANCGLLIDEAYELIHRNPESALRYVKNIDETNIFVICGTTKAFQIPGIRVGWAVASKEHIKALNNFGTYATGNVSHAAQKVALQILDEKKNQQLRRAIPDHYFKIRDVYTTGLQELGFKLFTGEGGFSHWVKLPGELTADDLNRCLYKRGAAVLPGQFTDMLRRGSSSPLKQFFRFCYGCSDPKKIEADLSIFKDAFAEAVQASSKDAGQEPSEKRRKTVESKT